ncbi:MAG: hypothetical protein ACUVXF_08620 [Desulfobaccales bacterium]
MTHTNILLRRSEVSLQTLISAPVLLCYAIICLGWPIRINKD